MRVALLYLIPAIFLSLCLTVLTVKLDQSAKAESIHTLATQLRKAVDSRLSEYRGIVNSLAALNPTFPNSSKGVWIQVHASEPESAMPAGARLLVIRAGRPNWRLLGSPDRGQRQILSAVFMPQLNPWCLQVKSLQGLHGKPPAVEAACSDLSGGLWELLSDARSSTKLLIGRMQMNNGVSHANGIAFLRWLPNSRSWVVVTTPISSFFSGLGFNRVDASWYVSRLKIPSKSALNLYTSRAHEDRPIWLSRVLDIAVQQRLQSKISGTPWYLHVNAWIDAGNFAYSVFFGGIIATVLLMLVGMGLSSSRRRARAIASRMTEQLRENRDLLASVADNIRDGVYRGTPSQGLVYVNKRLAEMLGFSSESQLLRASPDSYFSNPGQREVLCETLKREGHYHDVEVEYRRANGSHFTGLNSARVVRNGIGEIEYYVGAITDISERRKAERHAKFVANYDQLTGLPNRSLFETEADRLLRNRGNQPVGLLAIDLDRFKNVEDVHVPDVGDLILIEAASRLRRVLGKQDRLARISGDQFVVLVCEVTDPKEVGIYGRRILEALRSSFKVLGLDIYAQASIGIAIYPYDGMDIKKLFGNAESALYRAKEPGGGKLVFYESQLNKQAIRNFKLEEELRQAVAHDGLGLHFQPRVSLHDGRISGVEALARWNSPTFGAISPEEFIPLSERINLISEIGLWALRSALAEWRTWSQLVPVAPVIGINASAQQLRGKCYSHNVLATLSDAGVPHHCLEIELTETHLLDLGAAQEEDLLALKNNRIRLALDDFGTGYSNLAYLVRLDIDVVKIDRSFIHRMLEDSSVLALVRGMISLARDFGARVVAEGVETEEQLNALSRLGCDEVQGYLLARPMTAEDFRNFLREVEHDGVPLPFGRHLRKSNGPMI